MTTPDAESSSAVVVREARPCRRRRDRRVHARHVGRAPRGLHPARVSRVGRVRRPDSGTFVATLPPEAVAESDAVADARRPRRGRHPLVEGDGAGAVAASRRPWSAVSKAFCSPSGRRGGGDPRRPAARRFGVGTALDRRARLGRDRGARVCRNMVFSWNIMGLGQSRAVGFEPATEFRFAEPEPDASASMGALRPHPSRPSPIPTRTPRGRSGATATPATTCAGSRSTPTSRGPARRSPAGDWRPRPTDRLLAVADADALAGFAVRTRVTERETDNETIRTATYGTAAWRDVDAAGALATRLPATPPQSTPTRPEC